MSSYLVTFALPYANGPLHLGHMVEMFDADIWVRARRQAGDKVYFVSGNDAHGTPIMLKALDLKISEKELVDKVHQSHKSVIESYNISLDLFSRTDNSTHHKWVNRVYESLKSAGLVQQIEKEQAFDNKKQMFLPDRYVKGGCPKCKSADQNGDNCEVCGATYNPQDLIDPYSVVSEEKITFKPCPQLELDLEKKHQFLNNCVDNYTPKVILSKFNEWLDHPLKPWSISRHSPYHGLVVPDREKQHFYVWFDAPIGYLSFFDEALAAEKLKVEHLLAKNSDWKLIHFLGKDISYFHGLFWPVLLDSAGLNVPYRLNIHGFLTINGQKMSKSKGTFIEAETLVKMCHGDLLRYFIASKLSGQIDDINFEVDEFVEKVNSDLVGKFINILSRCSKLLFQYASGKFSSYEEFSPTYKLVSSLKEKIDLYYQERKYHLVCQEVMSACDKLNESLSIAEPWKNLKNPETFDKAHREISDILLAFEQLCYYLLPVIPDIAKSLIDYYIKDKSGLLKAYTPILHRLDKKLFKSLLEEEMQEQNQQVENKKVDQQEQKQTEGDYISIDDFLKVDLRVAKIHDAQPVEGADKLVQITLDLGYKKINVFAGIKKYYDPQELLGKKVIACVNLKPRKMKFGISEGMILAASDEQALSTLVLDRDVEVGSKVS